MKNTIFPVILAGGKGERFWPLSRQDRPKQFLSFDGSSQSLLQLTASRLLPVSGGWDGLWVITSSQLALGVKNQLPQLLPQNLLVESQGRDTAAAIAWASLEIQRRYGDDAIVGFFPSDHWITDKQKFTYTLNAAAQLATSQPSIVVLGVEPTHPSIAYGYIEQGEKLGSFNSLPAHHVKRFTEKPDHKTATKFINTDGFTWNTGIFIFQVHVLIGQMYTHAREIIEPIEKYGPDIYQQLPKKSIDYAIMEKTSLAYVLPLKFDWDDLGDWNAIERLLKKDDNPNVDMANHVCLDTKGAIVYTTNSEDVIATIGLENVVVVRDHNITLIVKKERTQEIKQLLNKLKTNPKFTPLL